MPTNSDGFSIMNFMRPHRPHRPPKVRRKSISKADIQHITPPENIYRQKQLNDIDSNKKKRNIIQHSVSVRNIHKKINIEQDNEPNIKNEIIDLSNNINDISGN